MNRVKGSEFLKKAKTYARNEQLSFKFDKAHGDGSHGTLFVGKGRTIVKDPKKEIGEGLLNAMLDQLGINKQDFLQGRKKRGEEG